MHRRKTTKSPKDVLTAEWKQVKVKGTIAQGRNNKSGASGMHANFIILNNNYFTGWAKDESKEH